VSRKINSWSVSHYVGHDLHVTNSLHHSLLQICNDWNNLYFSWSTEFNHRYNRFKRT